MQNLKKNTNLEIHFLNCHPEPVEHLPDKPNQNQHQLQPEVQRQHPEEKHQEAPRIEGH
jgi:hypothetical protein